MGERWRAGLSGVGCSGPCRGRVASRWGSGQNGGTHRHVHGGRVQLVVLADLADPVNQHASVLQRA